MSVLRLLRFLPVRSEFDTALRTVFVPDVLHQPGIEGVFAGRVGPANTGERLVASIWSSELAMRTAVGSVDAIGSLRPEFLDQSADHRLEVFEVAIELAPESAPDSGILRLVTGHVRDGCLEAYVAQAHNGVDEDRAAGHGPLGFYLAVDPPRRFATLSLWTCWADLEEATGADHHVASQTRHAELLEDWVVDHYEVIPGIPIVQAPASQPA